jgi:predicted P-loop ATPase
MDIVSKSGTIVGTQVPDHPKPSEIRLALNSQQKPIPNLDNVVRILEHHPRWHAQVWSDSFRQRIFTTYDCETPREWRDTDDIALTLWIQRCIEGLEKITRQNVSEAVQVVAMANQRDSLQEWLTQLVWDGQPRMHLLLTRGFGSEETPYTVSVSRYSLISFAARGQDPGCQVDTCPILVGDQGVGKSTGIRTLVGPDWYAECHADLMNKDFYLELQGKWGVEISELASFNNSETERIKAVISCRSDRYRPPYGRKALDHPRRCVFVGSTNQYNCLKDETGGRRFWPINCGRVDVDWIQENREQLFAEAVAAYNAGEQWWITDPEINNQARIEQENRRSVDAWEEPIQAYLEGRKRVNMQEILIKLGIDTHRQGVSEQRRVGKILKALRWKSKVERADGKVVRVWVRDVTP